MADKTVSAKPRPVSFPRRDEHGRAISLAELTVGALLGAVVSLLAVVLIDGITALVGAGRFGEASGWLALILPALLFFDDLRGWTGYPMRFVAAIAAAAAGLVAGLVVAGLASALPPVLSGALGAAAAVLVYSPVWFLGVRWLAGRAG